MSFFFGFATLVATAGIAAPLTVIAAAIAIALLGNTLSQFSRSRPSTGSFVTFIGRACGGYAAVVTAVVLGAGYIIAVASRSCTCATARSGSASARSSPTRTSGHAAAVTPRS